MEKVKGAMRRFYNGYKAEIYGFLIPLVIQSVVLAVSLSVFYTGLSANDCFEQYIPFFTELYDKLTTGESIFYSWTGALGYDFWSIICYYLASPLNLLIVFFGRKGIVFFVNMLIVLKLALCGASFAHYLRVKFKSDEPMVCALFGAMFALCGYMTGLCWNVMWMDSIILFPLIMLALDRLLYEKKPVRYTVLLAMALVFNYLVGFMICIFIFISFFTAEFKGIKDFFAKLFRIGVSSVIAIAMAAVVLLPSYVGLGVTTVSDETIPAFEWFGNWAEVFYTSMFATNPVGISWTSNKANLFMTVFGLYSAFVYLCSPGFKMKQKLKNLFILIILFVSMNLKPLNWIWHGFHAQNGIPNRFAFMAVFVMLTMAFQTVKDRKKLGSFEIFGGAILHIAFICLIWYLDKNWKDECIINIALVAIYFALFLMCYIRKNAPKEMALPVIAELLIMFVIATANTSGTIVKSYYESMDDVMAARGQIEAQESDTDYYRVKVDWINNPKEYEYDDDWAFVHFEDVTPKIAGDFLRLVRHLGQRSVINEEMMYGMHSMSCFSTFTNSDLADFYIRTGASASSNTAMYWGENAFIDMMLGVKYYFTRDHDVNSPAYSHVLTEGDTEVWENKYALAPGYKIPDLLAGIGNYYSNNPFKSMNYMSKDICGKKLYEISKLKYIDCNDCTKDASDPELARFLNTGFKSTATYTYTVSGEQEFQVYICCNDMFKTKFYINGDPVYEDRCKRQIVDLGVLSDGDIVAIEVQFQQKDKIEMNVYGAVIDPDVLQECYDILSEEQLSVTYYDDNEIKGTVSISEDDSKFLMSVPAADGWTVKVDGEKTETERFSKTFILMTLDKGDHTVELRYETPGFRTGLYITLAGIALTVIMYIIQRKRKYPEPEPEVTEEDVLPTEDGFVHEGEELTGEAADYETDEEISDNIFSWEEFSPEKIYDRMNEDTEK